MATTELLSVAGGPGRDRSLAPQKKGFTGMSSLVNLFYFLFSLENCALNIGRFVMSGAGGKWANNKCSPVAWFSTSLELTTNRARSDNCYTNDVPVISTGASISINRSNVGAISANRPFAIFV